MQYNLICFSFSLMEINGGKPWKFGQVLVCRFKGFELVAITCLAGTRLC